MPCHEYTLTLTKRIKHLLSLVLIPRPRWDITVTKEWREFLRRAFPLWDAFLASGIKTGPWEGMERKDYGVCCDENIRLEYTRHLIYEREVGYILHLQNTYMYKK